MEYNTENHRQYNLYNRNELDPNDDEIVIDNSSAKERRHSDCCSDFISECQGIFSESRGCKKVNRFRSQSSSSSDSSDSSYQNETPVKSLKKNLRFCSCLVCRTKSKKNKDKEKKEKITKTTKDTKSVERKEKTKTSSQNLEGINLDDLIINEREGIPDKDGSQDSKSLVSSKTSYRHRKKCGSVHYPKEGSERKTCHRYEIRSNWNNIKSNSGEVYINKKKSDKYEQESGWQSTPPPTSTTVLQSPKKKSLKTGKPTMSPISEKERKIILEFCHLLEKSKQLFNGLRELTPYGNKQWQAHFGRTFDIYAKLWKFQQQFRPVLDQRYGLKRWQIGEIASKIGQLYYHFYLRTSEIAYLIEAYSFYLAIRGRQYYNLASKEAKSELMVKKLRYYARFIVVAILLRQSEIINDLLIELEKQIVAYGQAYDPDDQAEWLNVLEEVRAFLNADPGVSIIDQENNNRIVTLSGRLSRHTIPPVERTLQMNLKLQDAIIIGSGTQLVKFSELTIDMFRMLQNLEWEIDIPIKDPSVDSPHASGQTSKTPKRIGVHCESGNVNPHKYLLFKPSACQVVTYVASTINELPKKGVLLIFISADGYHPHQNTHPENYTYDIGGLITSSKSDIYREYNRETKAGSSKYKNKHILYPGDLQPFTRKPLVLIVDSDNSYAFQHISRTFGLPLLVLMSPLSLPATINDRSSQGSLFTLFLHNPIAGLCNSCEIFTITLETWEKCSHLRDVFMKEAIHLLMRTRVDLTYHAFLGCEFLRLLILRYIFCECALRLHRGFRARTNLPRASPPLPDELVENCDLMAIVLDIADCIGVREYFYDLSGSRD